MSQTADRTEAGCCRPDPTAFENAAVLVTGSGSGIGLSVAKHFLDRGATVLVNDVSDERIQGGFDSIPEEQRPRVLRFAADIRDDAGVAAMVQHMLDECGRLDAVVSNAGIYPTTPFLQLDVAEWDAVMDTNVKGAFLVTQRAAQTMVASGTGGQIITISSGSYASAREGCAHYCASKAALVMLSKVMAMELAREGIRVNIVVPGVIDVGSEVNPLGAAYKSATVRQVPSGRLGNPDDVAHTVIHIAAPELSYMTGALIAVDGGLSLGRYGLPLSGDDGGPKT